LFDLQSIVRDVLDDIRNRMPVRRSYHQRLEDKHVQRAKQQLLLVFDLTMLSP
jgi:hypothetical protein